MRGLVDSRQVLDIIKRRKTVTHDDETECIDRFGLLYEVEALPSYDSLCESCKYAGCHHWDVLPCKGCAREYPDLYERKEE